MIVPGANHLSTQKLAELLNVSPQKIKRAKADEVKELAGFSIEGVSPFGYKKLLSTYLDASLLKFKIVWGTAGTPNTVFYINE